MARERFDLRHRTKERIRYESARFEKICGGKYLAPLYDPATQRPEDANVCIDQFEFPTTSTARARLGWPEMIHAKSAAKTRDVAQIGVNRLREFTHGCGLHRRSVAHRPFRRGMLLAIYKAMRVDQEEQSASERRSVFAFDSQPLAQTFAVWIAVLVLLYLCWRLVAPFLPAVTSAFALALVANPLHRRLERILPGKNLSAAISLIVACLLLVVPAILLTTALVREAAQVAAAIATPSFLILGRCV